MTNNRAKGISIVQFYKPKDQEAISVKPEYEKFANENRGLLRIGAIDCEEFSKICTKEKITKFPSYRVFPPYPVPTIDYEEPTFST